MKLYSSEEFIKSDATLGIKRSSGIFRCSIHKHTFIELVYILDGESTQIIDGVEYRAKRGDMMFISSEATHAFHSEESFSHVEIFFSPKLLEAGAITPEAAVSLLALSSFNEMRGGKSGGRISFSPEARAEIEFILDSMIRASKRNTRSEKIILESYLNILLVRMINEAVSDDENITEDIWQSLKAYIDEHPEEHITLSSLAAKSYYNPSYFSRVFKKKFDLSPIEYIRHRRVLRAMELLAGTDMPIDDIAATVGCSDRSTFYHIFGKETGLTPAEYRAKNKR